ncbi:hypothetical protein MM213_11480 [Belliella sp. R4-6]|uniref:Uncharacterized protein n=1 Tax=Belliella alkalica TaxID=1730871 RepID=A0ABS9VCF2_9BACT|nr:hypothetical protein [Belliella alkalica]MCH7414111.1 hypothetical protein [Belliella alkalica]
MIKPNNYNDWTDPHTKVALGLFFLFLFIAFGYGAYKSHIATTSDIRYTIINFYEKYSDSKRIGMQVFYKVEGRYIYDNCFSNDCKKIIVGEKRLGFYFIKDPSIYDVIFEISVPDSVLVPEEGWKEIPEFLKPK